MPEVPAEAPAAGVTAEARRPAGSRHPFQATPDLVHPDRGWRPVVAGPGATHREAVDPGASGPGGEVWAEVWAACFALTAELRCGRSSSSPV